MEKKYLFDLHDFNEPDTSQIEETPEEDLPPPPPVFSEEELEAEKRKAYAEGKQDGLSESAESRAERVAKIQENILRAFDSFRDREDIRETIYEAESVRLCRVLLEKAFPAFNQKHGLDEVLSVVRSVLDQNRGLAQIDIAVGADADDLAELEAALEAVRETSSAVFSIRILDTLSQGDVRMDWQDGGAVRDATQLSEKMMRILDERLDLSEPVERVSLEAACEPPTDSGLDDTEA